MIKQDTAQCSSCGVILPVSEMQYYQSQAGYEKDGWYCLKCLPSVIESDDSGDWVDELETDLDED